MKFFLRTVIHSDFHHAKKLSNALKPIIDKQNLPEGFNFDERVEAWPPERHEKLTAILEKAGILT